MRSSYLKDIKVDYSNPKKVSKTCSNSSLVSPSLVFYKKGDFDNFCRKRVDTFVDLGFTSITIFNPIHFLGTGSGQVILEENAPTNKEVSKCIDYILKRNLDINLYPHPESIVTMNGSGESQWRIAFKYNTASVDYMKKAYTPLIKALKDNSDYKGRINISIGAEIDSSVLIDPGQSSIVINKIKEQLPENHRKRANFTFNPNGDNYKWPKRSDLEQGNVKCIDMISLLESVKSINPSCYSDYKHVQEINNVPSYIKTRDHFLSDLKEYVREKACHNEQGNHKYMERLDNAIIKHTNNFSIGEFSLDHRSDHYGSFLSDMSQLSERNKSDLNVTLWNDQWNTSWDPLFTTKKGDKYQKGRVELLKFINCSESSPTPTNSKGIKNQ